MFYYSGYIAQGLVPKTLLGNERGAKLSAKCGTLPNGSLKTAVVSWVKKQTNYIDPSPFSGLVADYSSDSIVYKSTATIVKSTKPTAIRVFPNPVTERLYIEFPESAVGDVQCTIVNIFGRLVNTLQLTNKNSINVSALPAGVYFVKVCCNGNCENFKIVKK